MNFGIDKKDKKTFCKQCKNELKMIIPEIFNFCPYCSAPLTLLSYNLVKEKEKIIKLNTVNQIKNIISDEEDLKKLLLLVNKLSEN